MTALTVVLNIIAVSCNMQDVELGGFKMPDQEITWGPVMVIIAIILDAGALLIVHMKVSKKEPVTGAEGESKV